MIVTLLVVGFVLLVLAALFQFFGPIFPFKGMMIRLPITRISSDEAQGLGADAVINIRYGSSAVSRPDAATAAPGSGPPAPWRPRPARNKSWNMMLLSLQKPPAQEDFKRLMDVCNGLYELLFLSKQTKHSVFISCFYFRAHLKNVDYQHPLRFLRCDAGGR